MVDLFYIVSQLCLSLRPYVCTRVIHNDIAPAPPAKRLLYYNVTRDHSCCNGTFITYHGKDLAVGTLLYPIDESYFESRKAGLALLPTTETDISSHLTVAGYGRGVTVFLSCDKMLFICIHL